MPLSTPVARTPVHRRAIELRGYRREDGLWDIEGRITDTKDQDFRGFERGHIPPGEPIHDMWLRITVDNELTVHDIEASSDWFPYSVCPSITGRFALLKGMRIGPGWGAKTRELVGGKNGCTHLYDLLTAVATAAFQTVFPALVQDDRSRGAATANLMIDRCHAFTRGSEVIQRWWPEYADPSTGTDTASS